MAHMFEKASPLIKSTTTSFLERRITTNSFHVLIWAAVIMRFTLMNLLMFFQAMIYGKDSKRNEIMARGTELVLLGANGSLIGLPRTTSMRGEKAPNIVDNILDIEYRNLVLGILVGVEMIDYF